VINLSYGGDQRQVAGGVDWGIKMNIKHPDRVYFKYRLKIFIFMFFVAFIAAKSGTGGKKLHIDLLNICRSGLLFLQMAANSLLFKSSAYHAVILSFTYTIQAPQNPGGKNR
jgi:hypothetical protein